MTEETTSTPALAELPRTPVHAGEGYKPEWMHQYLPAPEAAKRIRALGRRRQCYLKVEQEGRIDATGFFPIMGSVKVSRHVAMEFVQDAYRGFTDRGALVHLVWCDNCLFIG